ncbi:hypothetical protein MmiAt1_04880 [Methanimicrococcus sp. At1]|uniref:Uncharacterized protein n=1 Tax=Methanimicrococcus hacksteinii TaxID=3028293 RepID=A0ABU3VNG5_9EURY|nr:hypothetical protein [Methanimicrococcus sp. At1]
MKHRFFSTLKNPNSVFYLSCSYDVVFLVLSGVQVCRKFENRCFGLKQIQQTPLQITNFGRREAANEIVIWRGLSKKNENLKEKP